jgi:hypothetical protein
MRIRFKTAKTRKPKTNTKAFLRTVVEDMKAKKAANMVNAIKEYIPEQAMSTAKVTGCPPAVDSKIVGDPYEEDNVTGKPEAFKIA